MKKRLTRIAIAILVCLVIGFLSGFATQTSVHTWYLTLNKPSFNPPDAVFRPVWTVLYIMMGISAGMVWAKGLYHIWVKSALYHFGFQLLINAMWSIVFFGLKEIFWALIVSITLLLLLAITIRRFYVVSKTAAYLLIPYFLWICFATALNYTIWELN